MKKTSPMASGRSRSITRRVSIVGITLVAASALAVSRPVFAETDPCLAANIVPVQQDSPLIEQDTPTVPDMGENYSPPSYEYDLAPPPGAPVEPAYPQTGTGPTYGPTYGGYAPELPNQGGPWMVPPESRFAQPFNPTTIPPTGMRELPPVGAAHAFTGAPQGFYGRNR
jgi:hypothetical protein